MLAYLRKNHKANLPHRDKLAFYITIFAKQEMKKIYNKQWKHY